MFYLKNRRLKGDIIVFSIIEGLSQEEAADLFSIAAEGRTRTSGWKLHRRRPKIRNFLTVRAIKQ